MSRVTIQDVDSDIAERLRDKGVTYLGNKYLKAAYIMEQAGVIDHLITMYDNGIHQQTSLLDMIEKSVEIGRIISGHGFDSAIQVTPKPPAPEPIEEPAPKFGA